ERRSGIARPALLHRGHDRQLALPELEHQVIAALRFSPEHGARDRRLAETLHRAPERARAEGRIAAALVDEEGDHLLAHLVTYRPLGLELARRLGDEQRRD